MLKIRKIVWTAVMTVISVSLTLATTNGVSHADGGTITGAVTAPVPKFKKDSVVYIENVPGNWPPTTGAKIDQKGLVFTPHVLPIVVNTTVEFLNYDNVLHNVFTPDKIADKFNLGTWPPGEIKTYAFKQAGTAILLCNVHAEMEGYVVVLQNPFFSLTDENGNYTIKDVPAGSYTLKVWNKKYVGKPQQIEVKSGQALQLNFELKK
ncbi:MAG: carboxypeptidase regulatory-like domain-containing protein [Candidatus Brocadiaceae bacterium]|nr:carboxypeptidase regulatory-like domain-containing protein [Candidatus Brocadiaceae bacterium]